MKTTTKKNAIHAYTYMYSVFITSDFSVFVFVFFLFLDYLIYLLL